MQPNNSNPPKKKKLSAPATCIALIKQYIAQASSTRLIEERRALIRSAATLIDFLTEMKLNLHQETAAEVSTAIEEMANELIALDKYRVLPKPFPVLDMKQSPVFPQDSAFTICLNRIDTLLHRLNMGESKIDEVFAIVAPLLEWLALVRLEPAEMTRAGFYMVMVIDTLAYIEQKSAAKAETSPLLAEKRQLFYTRRNDLRRQAIEP